MVTSLLRLLKITRFNIIRKSKYFKFILDYESTRSIYKKYTGAVFKSGEPFKQPKIKADIC